MMNNNYDMMGNMAELGPEKPVNLLTPSHILAIFPVIYHLMAYLTYHAC